MKRILFSVLLLTISLLTKAQPGSNIFDDSFLHEIRFENADTTDWIATKNYQMLNVIIDGNTIDSVGFKRKGNISAYPSTNKHGIKVKSNKYVLGRYYDGIKEFTLHMNYQDPTMMREKVTYDICNELGLFSLRTAFAKVYINNVYWGLYTIVEGKDEMYKHLFGNRSSNAIESLDLGNMCYYGNDVADYDYNNPANFLPRYELSNGDSLTAWPSFITMLDKANNTTNGQYIDTVSSYFNIEDFFKYQAANVYLMNFDSYISFQGNQIYVFDSINEIWQVTPWDFNASLGLWGGNNYSVNTYPIIPSSVSSGCIASKLNTIPTLKNYYLDAMCELSNVVCDTNTINSKIDQWKIQIQQAVYDDYRKVSSNSDFDNGVEHGYFNVHGLTNVPALKTLFSERYNLIKQGLVNEGYTCTVGLEEPTNKFYDLTIYPNPSSSTIKFDIAKNNSEDYQLTIFNSLGQTIFYQLKIKNPINIEHLKSGVYFVIINNEKEQLSGRFIKK
jgi:hypothetical protein